ncbi:Phr family secreted Rap phosphatase inhibitor [Bacillus sp. CRN 9]|nr:Phr family secreted Rap phosphatase inhibitor [Bacillus sp. CRN 9]
MKKIKLSVLGFAVIAVLSFGLNGAIPTEHSSSEIKHSEIKSLGHGWGI